MLDGFAFQLFFFISDYEVRYIMPCFKPVQAYRTEYLGYNGKYVIRFKPFHSSVSFQLPCGRCVGCRLERSRQWAVRCMHEASTNAENSYITLTYAPEFLPDGGTLVRKHFQDFMKRLRSHFKGTTIRVYYCGEYGPSLGRPHYHACLFGIQFKDMVFYKFNPQGDKLFTSDILANLWGKGFCTIGEVNFKSAAYVARYIMDKITGDLAEDHYGDKLPEFTGMSLKPGIGQAWLDKHMVSTYVVDGVYVNKRKAKPPRFYDKKMEAFDPDTFAKIKQARQDAFFELGIDPNEDSCERRRDREVCKIASIKSLRRRHDL